MAGSDPTEVVFPYYSVLKLEKLVVRLICCSSFASLISQENRINSLVEAEQK